MPACHKSVQWPFKVYLGHSCTVTHHGANIPEAKLNEAAPKLGFVLWLFNRERQGPSFPAHFALCLLNLIQRGRGLQAGFVSSSFGKEKCNERNKELHITLTAVFNASQGCSVGDNAVEANNVKHGLGITEFGSQV